MPAEDLIVKRRLEGLHLPREASQRQGAHVYLDDAGLDGAVGARDLEVGIGQERKPVACLWRAHAHPARPELALADPLAPAAAAAAQLGPHICPKSGGLQVVVDEDVIQPIETPRLDWQHRRTYALLDVCGALVAQRVQERPTST